MFLLKMIRDREMKKVDILRALEPQNAILWKEHRSILFGLAWWSYSRIDEYYKYYLVVLDRFFIPGMCSCYS